VPANPPAAEAVVVPPPPAPQLVRVPVGSGALSELPGDGSLLAWTADDGSSAAVIAAYAAFAAQSGTRLTLFVTGCYDAWDANAEALRPLVASGQIQLANHTWSHADLTSLPDDEVLSELQRTHDFIQQTWGVDARPFFRPPFGYHDERVDALAASIGYTVPTLWYGTLSDSGLITEQQVVDFATEWFLPQHIVIGHLNFDPVANVFPQLLAILQERGLQTVTLNDVFSSEQHP
jgi:peptidoglycan/xylan/chitin deacetylase (PgdA/CDA1 family)